MTSTTSLIPITPCTKRGMNIQRSYPSLKDLENANENYDEEEKKVKNKSPSTRMKWKRYSRSVYLLCLLISSFFLLYFCLVFCLNKIDMKNVKQVSLKLDDNTYKLMIVADLDKDSKVVDNKKGKCFF